MEPHWYIDWNLHWLGVFDGWALRPTHLLQSAAFFIDY